MDDKYEPPFTAQDHTKLVRAVMEKPLHVIKYLDLPPGREPTTQEVLEAALQVRSFDPATKARLKDAAAAFAGLEQERSRDEVAFNERQGRVRAATDGKPVEEKIAALGDLLAREDLDERSVAGLRFARDILVDGADSIYASESAFNELLPDASAAGAEASAAPASGHTTGAQQVAQVDAEVASHGGGSSVEGAAAGAASIGAAVSVIYDAFFA
jgi:hypothetical protein